MKHNGMAKLTTEQVVEMRVLRAAGASIKALRRQFNMSHDAVTKACTGKSYQHAGGPITNRAQIPQATIAAAIQDTQSMPVVEAAAKHGMSRATLSRYVRRSKEQTTP